MEIRPEGREGAVEQPMALRVANSVGPHMPRNRGSPARTALVSVVTAVACVWHSPAPTASAIGCYWVTVRGWTSEMAEVVGFPRLPEFVAIDAALSHGGWRVRTPLNWREQGARSYRAVWDNVAGEYLRLPGDSIVFMQSRRAFHELASDSIIVRWEVGGGRVIAYLASVGSNYEGIGQLYPRQLVHRGPNPFVRLVRSPCAAWKGAVLVDDR